MKTYPLYQVDAFTTERNKGNPAGVVLHADTLSEAQMQNIALRLNHSETAFVLAPMASDHEVWIRYFTPRAEVPICGHATIAAHFVRAVSLGLQPCTVMQKSGIGILPVEILEQDGRHRIVMTQGRPEFQAPLSGEIHDSIIDALGLRADDRDDACPMQIVSTGHSKVLVGITGKDRLHAIKPDMARLIELSRNIQCNGYYVFVRDVDSAGLVSTEARMFAPISGVPEDPVTGNAAGPLGAYLVKHRLVRVEGNYFRFAAHQGAAIGRAGVVQVEVAVSDGEPIGVKIGGDAVIAAQSILNIDDE